MAESTLIQTASDGPTAVPESGAVALHEPFKLRLRWAAPWTGLLVVAGALAPFRDAWAVQALLLLWVALAPGRLLLTALRVRPLIARRSPVYVVALSILVVMTVGLTVDGIGLALGANDPLRAGPLWAGFAVTYVVLLAWASTAPSHLRPNLAMPPSLMPYAPLLLPVLAAGGAARLNAGNGASLTVVTMFLVVAVLLVRPLLPGFSWRSASTTLYAVSLAGMWSFSLRGDSVYGYDVVSEYAIARQTTSNGVWYLRHPNDAYGSLLSISILPTSLHGIVGTSALVLFKLVFPAFAATLPIAILRLGSRLLSLRWAYIAATFAIGQVYFMAGLPALARQAIAFVFLGCLLMALTELRRTTRREITPVALLLGVGLVWSHYSTAYMACACLAAATVLGALLRPFARSRSFPLGALAMGTLGLITASALWYGGLTESTSNVVSTTDRIRDSGLSLLPNREGDLLSTLLKGNVAPPVTASAYESGVAELYERQYPSIQPAPTAGAYRLQPLSPVAATSFATGSSRAVALAGQLLNFLAIAGCVALLIRWRRLSRPAAVTMLVGIGTLAFLLLVRVSGTLAQAYNLERAQLQGLFVVAPIAMVLPARAAATLVRSRRRGTQPAAVAWGARLIGGLTALCAAILVFNAVGLSSLGSKRGTRANLSDSGLEAARFVLRSPDLAAAKWLANANPNAQSLTNSDVYGRLRLWLEGGVGGQIYADVTPRTLQPGSWIFLYSANTGEHGVAQAAFNGGPVTYQFPTRFIRAQFSRVYSNGSAEVYK